ncbi:MAG TPA: ATP-binding protein [Clostridia bacterium]|nr:ATP-binding protein [Clostridia bacterium]
MDVSTSFWHGLGLELKCLTVFRSLLKDEVFQEFSHLTEIFSEEKACFENMSVSYHRFCGLLLEKACFSPFPRLGNAWQDYLLDRLLLEENYFTRQAERSGAGEDLAPSLIKAARKDLMILQRLFRVQTDQIKNTIGVLTGVTGTEAEKIEGWPDWNETALPGSFQEFSPAGRLKKSFRDAGAWEHLLKNLIDYYRQMGTGLFGCYQAFRFIQQGGQGRLTPVVEPDPIRLSHLIGYEYQRRQVVENTEQFLAGFPANNLLLYGERGTGKSSTIKALVHEYGVAGLRLIEVAKQDLIFFPELLGKLKGRAQRFIIFIDDLSFEEGEFDYKYLKALLEGSLEARPWNVLIYATSNRRHLIKESFRDREVIEDGEVRTQDSLQEKLSLADRFGITIIFSTPDQEEYLDIVEGLARQRGLKIAPSLLREKALQWERWHNSRSGRTARQFIDDLAGKILMGEGERRETNTVDL